MKLKRVWHGRIGKLMQEHLELRESIGKVSPADLIYLHQFDLYLHKHHPKLKLPNRHIILHFLSLRPNLSPWGRRNLVIAIRQFCRFLNQRGLRCYTPDKTLTPKLQYKPRFFALTEKDVCRLMNGARTIRKNKPFVGETYAVIIGLLWCTGMRRKEVINLTHSDVDLKAKTILIRMTKFRKTRMIPVEASVVLILTRYLSMKKKLDYKTAPDEPFFTGLTGKRVRGSNLQHTFRRFVDRLGISNSSGQHPVLHDLRHNFATKTLNRFYSDTENYSPQSYLPTLATYLGHTDMTYSQHYLHPDFDLLQKASHLIEKRQKRAA
jgi:site-specific recombinase XerD